MSQPPCLQLALTAPCSGTSPPFLCMEERAAIVTTPVMSITPVTSITPLLWVWPPLWHMATLNYACMVLFIYGFPDNKACLSLFMIFPSISKFDMQLTILGITTAGLELSLFNISLSTVCQYCSVMWTHTFLQFELTAWDIMTQYCLVSTTQQQ